MARLSADEITERLADGDWRQDGDAIVRDLKLDDFGAAIELVNDVAELAEAANHHPDLLVHGYNKVRITLSTHSEGGLTAGDFELAREIDQLT